MKRFRKILAVFITMCMVTGMLVYSSNVEKAKAEVSGDYTYVQLTDTTVQITKYNGNETSLKVPGELGGKTVTEVGERAFQDCKSLEEVTLPETMVNIGNMAFSDCTNLTDISIPDSVENIGRYAFYGCVALTGITISDGVLSIGSDTFEGCTALTRVTIPDSVTSIGDYAFDGCINLKEIRISNNLVSIGNMAFRKCSALTEVMLPDTLTSIGDSAFKECTGLVKMNIPDRVTQIEDAVFSGCTNLSQITISDSVTSIGETAFSNCTSLIEVNIPDSVISIGKSAFSCCGKLAAFQLSNNITSIEGCTFEACTSLTKINIPSGVTYIKDSAFISATGLKTVVLPASVTRIENNAFYGCRSIAEIYYEGSQDQWDMIDIAASGNEPLSNAMIYFNVDPVIDVPDGFEYEVLSNGTIQINDCTSMEEVINIPGKIEGKPVTNIGFGAFMNSSVWREVHIPASVTKVDDINFRGCDKLEAIYVEDGNSNYLSEDGVLFNKDKTRLIRYPQGKKGDYLIPQGIESIANSAFEEAAGLTGVTIPSSVTTLGHTVFSRCSQLTEIKIPSSVTTIGSSAFEHCDRLIEMEFPSGMKNIPKCCFIDSINLTKVKIPVSVTAIEDAAFYKCYSLKDVYYDGVLEQWEKINIGTGGIGGIDSSINTNAPLVNAVIHFSDGTTLNGPKEEFSYRELDDGTLEITKYNGADSVVAIPEQLNQKKVISIGNAAFNKNTNVSEVSIPDGVTQISQLAFQECINLIKISIPESVIRIEDYAFESCANLQNIFYSGTKKQWEKIEIVTDGNDPLFSAQIHCKEEPPEDNAEEIILPITVDAKQELERLKSGDPFSLEQDLQHYLSTEQMDILESYLFTWLAEVNYTHQYSGTDSVKERIRKKSGIDPQGDFASGTEQAVTHVVAETKYGTRTFEVTLDLGAPDGSGNLYPSYGAMHYEVLEKGNLPSDLPLSGRIGRSTYTDLGPFADSVKKTSEDSLHHTYQWQSLDDEMTAGVLVDKTVTEIIGNKNGSFSDATFTVYVKPLLTYSKKVTIACPVDVFVYGMDGKEAGSIVNNQPNESNQNVRLDVNGDTKTVYLTGNDYYLNLRGTDTGTMKYEVEEIANEDVRRNVQFLELQLKKDMQYEGYVFRPLNIDRDLYALRTVDGNGKEVIYADTDSYQATFKRIQQMSLSQQNSSLAEQSTVQLSASLLPLDASNPNLNWSTDNESVVSVDSNGLVTAVGAGRATVTVSTKDGSFLKQFCMFDVADKGGNPGDDTNNKPGGGSSGGIDDATGGSGSTGNTPGNSGNPGSTPDNSSGSGSTPGNSSDAGNTPGNSGSSGSSGNAGSSGSSGNSSGSSSDGNSGNAGGSGQPVQKPENPVVVNLHYVIQFDTNGGTNLSRRTMTLLDGDSPGIMPKVQRKGYLFSGWYTQKEGGKQVAGDKPLEQAATLYARWVRASVPAKTASLKLVSKKKGQAKVSFQKVTGAAGYQVEYASGKDFASVKKKNLRANVNAKMLTGLKAGKKYYVRVRAYVLDSMGNKIYGAYSTVKSIRIQA